jgi:hypothetical protein
MNDTSALLSKDSSRAWGRAGCHVDSFAANMLSHSGGLCSVDPKTRASQRPLNTGPAPGLWPLVGSRFLSFSVGKPGRLWGETWEASRVCPALTLLHSSPGRPLAWLVFGFLRKTEVGGFPLPAL